MDASQALESRTAGNQQLSSLGAESATQTMADDSTRSTAIDMDDDSETEKHSGSSEQHVDVHKAKQEFHDLSRKYSNEPAQYDKAAQPDLEKALSRGSQGGFGGADRMDEFDLEDYLRNNSAARDEAGFKHKSLGVTWKQLSVVGAGGMRLNIRTFPNAVMEFFGKPAFMVLMKFMMPAPKTLLHDFDGCAKPGEMVLVLGRPGSGCSTFLKTIANQRGGYLEVKGETHYSGVLSTEFPHRGEVVYNAEEDLHNATLTVAQTLDFALATKTPARLLPGQTRQSFKKEVRDTLLSMLGITHTKHTLVGSAFVRGVSGGERKRVSVAEMMVARSCVGSWDNSTRGLDASTALDYAKALRVLTDTFKTTNFVSLYQAGEGIYNQFDKVLVIDEGRQQYYGPASEARQYFIDLGFKDLPRQTTADYLTGCTDSNERSYADGRSEKDVPSTAEALETAFKSSAQYKRNIAEREAWDASCHQDQVGRESFEAAVREDKRKLVPKKSPYTVSYFTQVRALTKRQFQIRWQDRLGLVVSYITSLGIAIVVGTVYITLPVTAAAAFSRGGVLFIALLFNSFQAFNELPTQLMNRPIGWKQVAFTFYHPSAASLGATFADVPFNVIQIFLFSVIIYFMTGLYRSAGAFFAFFVIVYAQFLSLASFFRLIGCICRDYNLAARLASVLVTAFVLYSGYIVPVFNMKRWLFWIYEMNPLAFGFSALMSNEFRHLEMTCDGSYITPRNVGGLTQYPTELGPNQVCTLQGSVAGSPTVAGSDYIYSGYQYLVSTQWRNFGLLLVFFVAFLIMQAVANTYLKHGADMPAFTVFAKETKELKRLNEELAEKRKKARRGELEQDLSDLIHTRKPFTWENLCYEVPVSGGKRQLLDHVFGFVEPGTLTALMGSSGAGKTTLLDVLADRKTQGTVSGTVLIDGQPIGVDFQRGTAYAEQMDVHEWTATVREALRFSAYLRQDAHISIEEKNAFVEQVLQLLEMEDIADAMIGFPGFGLSVEARKRLTIGVELAAKPQLLLFLDEPTTGLDGQSAYNLVRFLRKLSAAGQAILCTIHQPNALLISQFDRLLLLKSGGRTVYFGPIGEDSKDLRGYFARNGAECPPQENPAEFMLEAIGAGSRKRIGNKDWADRWLESEEFEAVKRRIAEINATAGQHTATEASSTKALTFATSFRTQMTIVGKRALLSQWRQPDYNFTKWFNHAAIALFTGLTFLNLDNSVASLQYRVFSIFIASILPAIIISTIEPSFIMARDTFQREASSRMYSTWVFAWTQFFAEMPNSILCAFSYWALWYWPTGFNHASSRAGYAFAMILVTELYSVTLGQAVGALSPSIFVASLANAPLLVMFSLFCGVTIPKPQIPHFWRVWLYQLDPFTRLISGLLINELQDLPIVCKANEFVTFNPPSGQTCQQWAGAFVAAGTGYLDNPNDTTGCNYCQYRVGQQFTDPLDIQYQYRGRDIGIFVAFFVFNLIVLLIASRFLRYSKR
ncbi:hypothetical protein E5Q_00239 [Mixia osmundae IAM 14324]|uniref:ABC transporter domain-containing protein n=1 Tax=Mixia osmundae (strain CBS 9802 / IAM 14324 / JCM 22182 / KY 12970) TaxID=764103 RepID=G7DSN5_MIXOS|nr:hypothetical protein E5Q_00239 [Mixia osmundae IAM 14324]